MLPSLPLCLDISGSPRPSRQSTPTSDCMLIWRCVTTSVTVLAVRCKLLTPLKPAGLLQSLDVPPHAWHTATTDHITDLLLATKGNDAVAVSVDTFTRMYMLCHVLANLTLLNGANMCVDHVGQFQEFSAVMISDGGPQLKRCFQQGLSSPPRYQMECVHCTSPSK